MPTCPFGNKGECDKNCALFIQAEDLNELVASRLNAIGVFNKKNGACSFRHLALSLARFIFENTNSHGR